MDLSELKKTAAEVEPVNLSDVTALAHKQLELEAEVARKEAELKNAQAELRRIKNVELPEALRGAGLTSLKLDNGMTVSLREDLKASIPKKNIPVVAQILREWGYGDVVKNKVEINVGQSCDNVVATLVKTAEDLGVPAAVIEDVNTTTVKKILREKLREGADVDLTKFGAFEFTEATVK